TDPMGSSEVADDTEPPEIGDGVPPLSTEDTQAAVEPSTPADEPAPSEELPDELAVTTSEEASGAPAEETGGPGALNPKLLDQLRHEATDFPNLLEIPVEEGRTIVRRMVRETDDLAGGAPAVAMLKTSSFALPDHRVPVRVYLPTNGEAPFPVVVYFHGGGWVFGDVDTHDSVCREIANRSECAVVSVGYRRAPEHKFPDPLEDCYGAVQWVADLGTAARLQTDPGRIAVAGDSAGGNMAAVVCLLARERGGPTISGQVLICPVTAHDPDTPSYRENATGFGFEVSFMPWMWAQYLRGPEDASDPHVAPVRARDLSHLPSALVVTAECDLLRDEGEEYGERLRAAGVAAQVTRYPGMPHGFIDYRGLVDEGWDALDEIGEWLRRLFGRDEVPPPQ
ncbi:MAG: alpha/beta hydrolase, partial [Thermoplasmata archaeon]|nr:alpha/beta hydrolase [Thermoplasmata archaeon]